MEQATVTIPASTIEKLAALGKAMVSLAEDMRKQAAPPIPQPLNIPIPSLTRPEVIPEGEEWFWSEEWLSKEREANEDIRAGRVSRTFKSVEELIADLQHPI